ncbi:hypothetical protein FA15DRAFT_754380 [Coprinopsis marcescibilis]|uniref:Uncharacterized protein n=1 Tax=Coprinopsis marcescibilis TaxID=230819 RepID=A0A5C3L3W2_COPMA|nr:hypothetical protein FA15DRAFT_754380 [Coprinopsis marcescibilis]
MSVDGVTAEELEFIGNSIIKGSYASSVISLVAAGIQCFMCLYCISIFFETPVDMRKGRAPYIVVSVFIFAFYSLSVGLDASLMFDLLFGASTGAEVITMLEEEALWSKVLNGVAKMAFVALGDGLLVYRCYIVWDDSWAAVALPLVTYVALIGTHIWQIIQRTHNDLTTVIVSEVLRVGLAFVTNLAITFLIGYQLVRSYKEHASTLPPGEKQIIRATHNIITETAVLLTLFTFGHAIVVWIQLAQGFSVETGTNLKLADTTFALLYYAFAALAPQTVIFRVSTGRSWNIEKTRDASQGIFSRSIAFAHAPTEQSLFVSQAGDDSEDNGTSRLSSEQEQEELITREKPEGDSEAA